MRALIAAIVAIAMSDVAFALNFVTLTPGDARADRCDTLITGVIEIDSADQLSDFVWKKYKTTGTRPLIFCLNSEGGSLIGAMQMAEWLWHEAPSHMEVADGDQCLSACVIVLASGRNAYLKRVWREVADGAVVGIHGFYMNTEPGVRDRSLSDAELVELGRAVSGRLVALMNTFQVHPILAQTMLTSAPDEWTFITHENMWWLNPGRYCYEGFRRPPHCDTQPLKLAVDSLD